MSSSLYADAVLEQIRDLEMPAYIRSRDFDVEGANDTQVGRALAHLSESDDHGFDIEKWSRRSPYTWRIVKSD